jgi:hypothetical protein
MSLRRPRSHGRELVGEIPEYEDVYRLCFLRGPDVYRLCFLRGPEGIIIGLAKQLS